MFHGLSHVDVPVKDLERAFTLYSSVFGFAEQRRGDGFVDVDAGGISLRIHRAPHNAHPARLRLRVHDVSRALDAAHRGGASRLYEPMRTADLEEVAIARDPDGNLLLLWRPLTEDEYDFTPSLPKDLAWNVEAEQLLQRLLSHVPALFRGLARRRVTALAEELAVEHRAREVGREQVIRAFILGSARVTRGRTRAPLLMNGVDLDQYQADFEA